MIARLNTSEAAAPGSALRRPARRKRTRTDKQIEQRIELRQWKRWRRERLETLLAGPYAEPAQALLTFCKTMTGPSALVDFIRSGPWNDASPDVRFEILALVDAVIIQRRERMGLVSFDDALPGEPDNVFRVLRELLAPPPGAQPGLINETSSIRNTEHV
jgi:hypothetical protein